MQEGHDHGHVDHRASSDGLVPMLRLNDLPVVANIMDIVTPFQHFRLPWCFLETGSQPTLERL